MGYRRLQFFYLARTQNNPINPSLLDVCLRNSETVSDVQPYLLVSYCSSLKTARSMQPEAQTAAQVRSRKHYKR